MTVKELINELQQYPEESEVRLAMQPNWPFEYSISDVVYTPPVLNDNEEEEEIGIVYLAEERQIGYLPGIISEELGWR